MTKTPPDATPESPTPSFTPVAVRARHDGWTPERQVSFIEALGECGCVADACRRVGMSTETAYALRRRYDAQSFRLAWDAALDFAIRRLSDAAFSRAIHGVAVPHYYKGEQVGEHRRYDERLTQFLLRYRDPARYGDPARYRDPARYGAALDGLLTEDGARGEVAANQLHMLKNRAGNDARDRAEGFETPPLPIRIRTMPPPERGDAC